MKSYFSLKWSLLLLILLINIHVLLAQSVNDIITNDSVIKMTKAGLPKSVILAKIQNSNTNFDVSVDAIIKLKKQGVNDDVLTVMATKGSSSNNGSNGSNNVVPTAPINANYSGSAIENTFNNEEPGIYYLDESNGKPLEIDPSIFSAGKRGSGILTDMTYGIAKTVQKSILSGAHANFQVNSKSPAFYFVFPRRTRSELGNESSGATGFYNNASSPNEFVLIKFSIVKATREVETGSFGTYSGFSSGIAEKNKVAFRYTKISSTLYKVYFESPLSGGEYAFIFSGAAVARSGETPTQKAFDFSLSGNAASPDKTTESRTHRSPPNPLNLFRKKPKPDSTKA